MSRGTSSVLREPLKSFGTSSLHFDGIDDSLAIPYPIGTSPFSLFMWLKVTQDNALNDRIVDNQQAGPTHGFGVLTQSQTNRLSFNIYNAGTAQSGMLTPNLQFGRWYHIGLGYEQDNGRLWVNGVLESQDGTCTMSASTTILTLGKRAGTATTNYSQMSIADLQIYDRRVPTADVPTIYSGKGTVEGLAARYTFQGTALDTVGTYHGTVSGCTYTTDIPSTTRGTLSAARRPNYNFGSSLTFDGANDRLDIPYDFGTSPFTVGMWIQRGKGNIVGDRFVDCCGTSLLGGWYMTVPSSPADSLQVRIQGGTSGTTLVGSVSTNYLDYTDWHHLMFSFTPGALIMYQDGSPVGTHNSGAMGASLGSTSFGARVNAAANFSNFHLNDVQIYNRVLTADEISDVYHYGVPQDTKSFGTQSLTAMGLTARYTFDGNVNDSAGTYTGAVGGTPVYTAWRPSASRGTI